MLDEPVVFIAGAAPVEGLVVVEPEPDDV